MIIASRTTARYAFPALFGFFALFALELDLGGCSSSSSSDPSCGSSCGNSVSVGAGTVDGGSYSYGENNCACPSLHAGAAEGAPCTKASDCAETCCTCATCGTRSFAASSCVNGQCATKTLVCQTALAQDSHGDLCAK